MMGNRVRAGRLILSGVSRKSPTPSTPALLVKPCPLFVASTCRRVGAQAPPFWAVARGAFGAVSSWSPDLLLSHAALLIHTEGPLMDGRVERPILGRTRSSCTGDSDQDRCTDND